MFAESWVIFTELFVKSTSTETSEKFKSLTQTAGDVSSKFPASVSHPPLADKFKRTIPSKRLTNGAKFAISFKSISPLTFAFNVGDLKFASAWASSHEFSISKRNRSSFPSSCVKWKSISKVPSCFLILFTSTMAFRKARFPLWFHGERGPDKLR